MNTKYQLNRLHYAVNARNSAGEPAVTDQMIYELVQLVQSLLIQQPKADLIQSHFTTEQFAAIVNLAPETVRQYCNKGRILAVKSQTRCGPQKKWVIERAELERFQREGLLPASR